MDLPAERRLGIHYLQVVPSLARQNRKAGTRGHLLPRRGHVCGVADLWCFHETGTQQPEMITDKEPNFALSAAFQKERLWTWERKSWRFVACRMTACGLQSVQLSTLPSSTGPERWKEADDSQTIQLFAPMENWANHGVVDELHRLAVNTMGTSCPLTGGARIEVHRLLDLVPTFGDSLPVQPNHWWFPTDKMGLELYVDILELRRNCFSETFG